MTVEVVERLDELLGDLAHFLLAEVTVVLQNLEQLTLGEFCDDAELVGRLEGVEEQDNVFVVETLEDLNLLSQVIHLLLGLASLGDELEGDDLPAALAASLVDFTEGTFADGVQNVILVHCDDDVN
eukprot:CAMPEP_0185573314 /NCGR_PEP_ID=MMETSP0434-20130131/5066_1 /TAXON_ID=626734 ORGANISM="Favella taraikaensis, Strain Fe Narragansett Bay" /NCGR_SAMPLE_ID=MMETSP0434 /ASSEMBLY_ACC=CAM_ASM_000379 /LENGTH=125 /DNA_ID=CAMNT_0028189519 /DNA_START=3508 /DNA_END=3882 /DNA_ORIENTATION=-